MPGISSNVRCYIRVCHKALFLLFVLERFAISALSLMNLFFFFNDYKTNMVVKSTSP